MSPTASAMFTPDDLLELGDVVAAAWRAGVDRDWTAPAGTLEWTCRFTADHTVDCVFSYALFLASRKLDDYPPFGELHALDEATPGDIVDGLITVTRMLWSVIVTSPADVRAVILRRPAVLTAPPSAFAARGGQEMILHGHDVATGLGVPFDPPADLCRRLRDNLWSQLASDGLPRTDDPWSDLLEQSGRARR